MVFSSFVTRPVLAARVPGTEPAPHSRHPERADFKKLLLRVSLGQLHDEARKRRPLDQPVTFAGPSAHLEALPICQPCLAPHSTLVDHSTSIAHVF